MRYWKRFFYSNLYKILCLIPRKPLVCFIEGETSRHYSNIDILWKKASQCLNIIRIDGFKYNISNIWKLSRASVIVTDQSYPVTSNLHIDKRTSCVQVWHSSGFYKCVAFDAMRKGYEKEKELSRLNRIHGNIDWLIISDEKLVKSYAEAFHLHNEQVLPLGLARTDLLYSCDPEQAKEKFFQSFPEVRGKKILLYAPTFRVAADTGLRTCVVPIDFSILQAELGEEWCFALRRHPSVKGETLEGWIDVSSLSQEDVLSMSDALVTDYSSILFDYSFFKRPIFLFIQDIGEYKKERDLYINPHELVGDENVCRTVHELIKKIHLLSNSKNNIWENYMSACDGNSTNRVIELITSLQRRG